MDPFDPAQGANKDLEAACPGLADAIDAADTARIREAIATACRQTPSDTAHLVLG